MVGGTQVSGVVLVNFGLIGLRIIDPLFFIALLILLYIYRLLNFIIIFYRLFSSSKGPHFVEGEGNRMWRVLDG